MRKDHHVTRIVIVGGGPGGYEAALVAAQLGAEVTVVERDGLGGACVLADCVPSKTLIATSDAMTALAGSHRLGVRLHAAAGLSADQADDVDVDLVQVNERVRSLAAAQSADVAHRLEREGVRIVAGAACLRGANRVVVGGEEIVADAVLLATGASPRTLPGLEP